jgi:ATP adenylyltransferase
MQLIPLASLHESTDQPNSISSRSVPLVDEPIVAHIVAHPAIVTGEPFVADGLSFGHAVAFLGESMQVPSTLGGRDLHEIYQRLLVAAQLPNAPHVNGSESSYNVLLTQKWMMVVPRTAEQFGGVFVNSVGFAGYMLLKGPTAYETIEGLGAMKVLERVATARAPPSQPEEL